MGFSPHFIKHLCSLCSIFSRRCDLLGPEVISGQPGVVDLQEEVGVVDCGPQNLEGGG